VPLTGGGAGREPIGPAARPLTGYCPRAGATGALDLGTEAPLGRFGRLTGFFRGLKGSAGLLCRTNPDGPPFVPFGVGVWLLEKPEGEALILRSRFLFRGISKGVLKNVELDFVRCAWQLSAKELPRPSS
jgi:hypothetical protein